ncbi:MarR family transcriptional regulator [Cryomorphaceae bacterium 1068]|nr:MarR family transcriptional regulator [Cryomorphaceae bacterium 1068]
MKIEEAIHQKKFQSEFEKLVVNIIYTSRWLEYEEGKLFRKYDITLPQYNLLRILRGQLPKAASVNLLIDRMLDKSSNASRIVETLRKKGLVDRKACKADRRKVDVIINKKGLEVLEAATKEMATLHENHKKSLTTKEAEQLNELLDKLRSIE